MHHFSNDQASYGQLPFNDQAPCVIAIIDMTKNDGAIPDAMLPLEWLSSTATTKEPFMKSMRTPRRYTYGKSTEQVSSLFRNRQINLRIDKCTVAVAMLADVPEKYIPEAPAGPFVQSTLDIWGAIHQANVVLMKGCLTPPNTYAGWASTGNRVRSSAISISLKLGSILLSRSG